MLQISARKSGKIHAKKYRFSCRKIHANKFQAQERKKTIALPKS
jgi:hypothetical protein